METVTTRVDSDTHGEIQQRAEETEASKSAVARELIQQGLRSEDLRVERDRLREQLAATNRRVDEHVELQEYVRNQQKLERRRADREERRAGAGALTRAKWWMFGMNEKQEREQGHE